MIRRAILSLLNLAPLADLRDALDALRSARAEAGLLRVQLEYADQIVALLQMRAARVPEPVTVWRVEWTDKELN